MLNDDMRRIPTVAAIVQLPMEWSDVPSLDIDDNAQDKRKPTSDTILRSASSFHQNTQHPWRHRQKIATCIASTFLALLVGLQFGALSVEEDAAWANYLYRFTPSFLVNFMGALVALQDVTALFQKLKKDPETNKRDSTIIGPFMVALLPMIFAVVATLPLAKDSTKHYLASDGTFTKAWGLSDAVRLSLQIVGMGIWCLGYTAPTRLETGHAIGTEVYQGKLMSSLQPERHALALLARDMKKFPLGAQNAWSDSTNITVVNIRNFYEQQLTSTDSYDRLKIPRRLLILGCVPLALLLQDEAQRGWSELGVKSNIAKITLGTLATASAFVFFVRSSQMFLERFVLAFQGVSKQFEKQGVKPSTAHLAAAAYLFLLGGIAFGSCFGWFFEVEQFLHSNSPLKKAAFPGYQYYFAFYALLANYGFELSFTNGCIGFANKYDISILKALMQKLTRWYNLQDTRPIAVQSAELRLANAMKGKAEVEDLNEVSLNDQLCNANLDENNLKILAMRNIVDAITSGRSSLQWRQQIVNEAARSLTRPFLRHV